MKLNILVILLVLTPLWSATRLNAENPDHLQQLQECASSQGGFRRGVIALGLPDSPGVPKSATSSTLTAIYNDLESANHPGANHFYIHTVEASPEPDRAIPCADRLRNLVPGSGHLVHMPSHIYIRVGRYHDAAIANQRAIAVDQNYITQSSTPGFYRSAYVPHNPHFLWASASMEGRSELAMQAARHTAAMVDQHKMRQPEYDTLQHYYLIPLYTLARFGKWDEILAEPSPGQELKYPTGVWHYARGMAFLS